MGNSRVQSLARVGLRWLALFHRWVGVGLCLLVTLWFASGVVLHFVPYPALSESERLERGAHIDLSLVRVTPAVALTLAPDTSRLRLVDVAGRPVYIMASKDGSISPVAADTGQSRQRFRDRLRSESRAPLITISGPSHRSLTPTGRFTASGSQMRKERRYMFRHARAKFCSAPRRRSGGGTGAAQTYIGSTSVLFARTGAFGIESCGGPL